MGHKIFVSYKYGDDNVKSLDGNTKTKARDYVTKLDEILSEAHHVYKGEDDDEDLSGYGDDYIWEKLKDKIYDSTLTIVLISPNMKEVAKKERDQWIPWEISYSLKEQHRKNSDGQEVLSNTNAMIAVVLPDSANSYEYYLHDCNKCWTQCREHKTEKLFSILENNMFNIKDAKKITCNDSGENKVFTGECSYIADVKWDEFILNVDTYIDRAYNRLDCIENYNIVKEI